MKSVIWMKEKNSQTISKVRKVNRNDKLDEKECLTKFIVDRCSVHGVQYIFDPELHTVDKIIWLIFLSLFIYCTTQEMSKIILEYQVRFF